MSAFVITRIVGRWALLDSGEWVTPIDSFADFAYNSVNFDRAIAAFHHDPHLALERRIADRIVPRGGVSPSGKERGHA